MALKNYSTSKSLFSKDEELDVVFKHWANKQSGMNQISLWMLVLETSGNEIWPLSYMQKGELPLPEFLLFLSN